MSTNQSGGAFLPGEDAVITGAWQFSRVLTASSDVTVGGTLTVAGHVVQSYTEGTWTPTLSGTGGGSGQVYGEQVGHYVKVGKLVTASFDVGVSTAGTISGAVIVGGLPFPASGKSTCSTLWATTATSWVNVIGFSGNSTSYIQLLGTTLAGNTNSNPLTPADITSGTTFYGTISYFTP
jgi:hypothetical protein